MFQDVRMPFLYRQASSFGHGLEDAKELRAVESPALLRCEQGVRAISSTRFQPRSKRGRARRGCQYMLKWGTKVIVPFPF